MKSLFLRQLPGFFLEKLMASWHKIFNFTRRWIFTGRREQIPAINWCLRCQTQFRGNGLLCLIGRRPIPEWFIASFAIPDWDSKRQEIEYTFWPSLTWFLTRTAKPDPHEKFEIVHMSPTEMIPDVQPQGTSKELSVLSLYFLLRSAKANRNEIAMYIYASKR